MPHADLAMDMYECQQYVYVVVVINFQCP